MRRLAALLSLLFVISVAAPAHAAGGWPTTKCVPFDDSAEHLCLDVYWSTTSDGLKVPHIYERITGPYWENNAFQCDWITARNSHDVIKWRKDGSDCDIAKSPPYTLFHPGLDLQTDSMTITMAGWPHINAAPDPGYTKVTVNIP